MRSRISDILQVVLTVCAITITGLLVRREFLPAASDGAEGPSSFSEWSDAVQAGLTLYSSAERDTLVEFVDFECPACAHFERATVDSLAAAKKSTIILVHFPLQGHKHALASAQAFECAVRDGAAREMVRQLYANQKLFGSIPWSDLATTAGVRDLGAFESCLRLPLDSFPRIVEGAALARRAGLAATPTAVFNGIRFPTPPTFEQLTRNRGRW